MPSPLSRLFTRTAKRLAGKPLEIEDISTVVAKSEPGYVTQYKAKRQHNSEYWHVYRTAGFYGVFASFDLASGVSLKEAVEKLEQIESGYEAKLRGQKRMPYNHYSKIRALLTDDAPAPAAAEALETQQAVTISAPLALKKQGPSA